VFIKKNTSYEGVSNFGVLRFSVMGIKYVFFIQICSFFVYLHSSSKHPPPPKKKFTEVSLKCDKMSVHYTSLNSWRSFWNSLSCIYLAIITPNKNIYKSSFTLLCFIKILTNFFLIVWTVIHECLNRRLKYPTVKRTTTKMRSNPTLTWWRNIERNIEI